MAKKAKTTGKSWQDPTARRAAKPRFRSQLWFDNPDDPGATALYFERYLNYGLTRGEIMGGKPIIGIAQTGSDLSPCNRHHLELAKRVRDGIRDAGGIAFEFPMHPIQETGKRPTAALDRNLAYLGLVEVLHGYPIDGVVLTTGCDKTTPAAIMAAATVNIPAIVLSGGPMLNGWWKGERAGSGTIKWAMGKRLAAGEIGYDEFVDSIAAAAPSIGHCNSMGTASTMNALAEALGLSLPGCAVDPGALQGARADRLRDRRARGRDRARRRQAARPPHPQGVRERHRRLLGDRRLDQCADPSQRDRAPCRRAGSRSRTGRPIGYDVPLLVNMQPAGHVSRRGLSPRRRPARRAQRAAQGQAPACRRDDRQRQDHRRERRGAPRSRTPTSSVPTASR